MARPSLADLMGTASDNAELAFLSACQTAVGNETIPEESMLAAGMLAVRLKGAARRRNVLYEASQTPRIGNT